MPTDHKRNTTRQREAGAASRAETRRRLLQAAGEEFAERGYHAATVSRIAARAGVTVQTLYLAWGSKRALLRGFMDASFAGSPDTQSVEELERSIDDVVEQAGADPRSALTQMAHLYRELTERTALGRKLYSEAAASDPQIAAEWQEFHRLRRDMFARIIHRIPAATLRPELTAEVATDTAWVIASPESQDLLIRTMGYSLDDYEQWMAMTLANTLLR